MSCVMPSFTWSVQTSVRFSAGFRNEAGDGVRAALRRCPYTHAVSSPTSNQSNFPVAPDN
jgi:hypothetical protein